MVKLHSLLKLSPVDMKVSMDGSLLLPQDLSLPPNQKNGSMLKLEVHLSNLFSKTMAALNHHQPKDSIKNQEEVMSKLSVQNCTPSHSSD